MTRSPHAFFLRGRAAAPIRSAPRLSAAFAAMTLALGAPAASAMSYKLVSVGAGCGARCPLVISAEGEIERGSAESFIEFLRGAAGSDRLRNIVFIHSPGGNVVGAMKLGAVFRKAGTAVVVAQAREGQGLAQDATFLSAECLSACVYAIMGGKTRVVPPQSTLGVHRTSSFRFVGKDPAGSEPGYQRIQTPDALLRTLADYTRKMGISAEVLAVAQAAPSNSIRVLTRREVSKWRLGKERF